MINLIEFIKSYDTENHVRWIVKNRFRLLFVAVFGFLSASVSAIPYINLIISRSIAALATLVLFVILFKTKHKTLFKLVPFVLAISAVLTLFGNYYYSEVIGEYAFFLVLVGFIMLFIMSSRKPRL